MRSLRSSLKSRLFAAAAAVIAVAVVALLLPAAATAQQGGTSGLANGGVLLLHLGSSGTPQDYLGFRPSNSTGYGTQSKTQSITNGPGCHIALGTTDQLVTFTPTSPGTNSNPFAGFVSDAIGVGSKGEGTGQPCGRIDRAAGQTEGQTLTMNLGGALDGKLIDYAEIDVELKFGATLKVTGLIDGTPVGASETYSSSGSDSGPDSMDGDNYRIRFPRSGSTAVNQLKFQIDTATGGASLEGGADGTAFCDPTDPSECGGSVNFSLGQTLVQGGTTDSLFHLIEADGVLDCPGQGTSSASEDNPGVLESTLSRQTNEIDPSTGQPFPCEPIPYNLESGEGVALGCTSPQCILLQKDVLGQHTQFIWKVTWNPESSSEYPETATEFDFDLNGTFQPLQRCLIDTDGDHLPQLPLTLDGNDGDAVDPWCIMDTIVDFNPDTGLNTVTEFYFGKMDPSGHR